MPVGKEISTSDIPRMAIGDYCWSVSMALSIAWLFPILDKHSWSCGTSDIYYDPKSLTEVHRSKILESLQSRLKKQVNNSSKNLVRKGSAISDVFKRYLNRSLDLLLTSFSWEHGWLIESSGIMTVLSKSIAPILLNLGILQTIVSTCYANMTIMRVNRMNQKGD